GSTTRRGAPDRSCSCCPAGTATPTPATPWPPTSTRTSPWSPTTGVDCRAAAPRMSRPTWARTRRTPAGYCPPWPTGPPWCSAAASAPRSRWSLTVRHPAQVRRAVIHEPPVSALLPDGPRVELVAAQLDVEQAHHHAG